MAGRRWPVHAMPHNQRRQMLCGMEGPSDPQHRPTAPDEVGIVATGITALVATRILETKGDPVSAANAHVRLTPSANSDEPRPLPSRTAPRRDSAPDVLIVGAGPAGVAAAAELARRGISAHVLERGESVATS